MTTKNTYTREQVATILRTYIRTEGCSCCQYNDKTEEQIRAMAYELADEGQPDFKFEETDEERRDREDRRAQDVQTTWDLLKASGLTPTRYD